MKTMKICSLVPRIRFIILLSVIPFGLFAQNSKSDEIWKKGALLLDSCKYKECLDFWKSFENDTVKAIRGAYEYNHVSMAVCCIQLGYPADSAYHYLIGSQKNLVVAPWLSYPEFEKIENDPRWEQFLGLFKKRYTKTTDTLGIGYQLLLTSITDQRNRQKLTRKCAYPDLNKDELWKIINRDDSINLSILMNIVEKHGWPTISKVGKIPSGSAFFVLQHANLSVQEKYLPTIDSLAKIKEVNKWDFVYLADRVMTRKTGVQLYGTQSDEKGFVPIFEPENLNIRCRDAGIPLWTDEELVKVGIDPKIVKK
jgi:hypothetical protein